MRIALSAGEASGDRLGAGLARALSAACPGIELSGMGGDEMAEAGVRLVQHAREVAVVGIVEVARHLPTIRNAMARMRALLEDERPDLFVPIDYPDFNLRLAAQACAAGVPVVYYVSPQVWAWRRGRVRTIRDLVRRVLVLFPFETAFYERERVPATFVGHPAAAARARADRAEVRRAAGLDPARPLVALLPGSRRGEVGRLLPILGRAGRVLAASHSQAQFVIPKARTLPPGLVETIAAREAPSGTVVLGDLYPEILEAADCGAVASGTATLDAALAGMPLVAVYRMQPLSYLVARALVDVAHVALPNLVAGRRIVPELVQGDCTPEGIARELAAYLADGGVAAAVRAALGAVREGLHGDGAYERAAAAVLAEVGRIPD
ncbi:MAG TPA: lipid-A-disaccharide synthase [Candidatus Sulfotelmatobacter sp.]|nr:lipid-A-disaccharide synthase [Candidatus Sulfotelmatobacter sp.]